MTLGRACESDRGALTALWKTAFPKDGEEDISAFLSLFPSLSSALVLREGRKVVSMLYLLPLALEHNGVRLRAYNIYAGATLPPYRGRGCYRALLDYAAAMAGKEGVAALVLRPASVRLFESYRRMGFTEILPCARFSVERESVSAGGSVRPVMACEYLRERKKCLRGLDVSFADWDENIMSYALRWCRAWAWDGGCALAEERGEKLTVWELLCPHCEVRARCAGLWEKYPRASGMTVYGPACLGDGGDVRPYGLMRRLSPDVPKTPYYMGYAME